MQELQEFADDIASCPLADVQNLLSDDYTLQSRKCSLMKQMRRYKKHYIGIQIDDSFGLSTLHLSSHTIPASSSFPTYNNTYNVSTAAISFNTTARTVPSDPFAFRQPICYDYTAQGVYTTTENSRSMQHVRWPEHRRQCDDIYDRLGSYENLELSGKDQYPLNPSLQQAQTGANGLNVLFTNRP